MIEILATIASHPVYIVASTVALLGWFGFFGAIAVIECKEHLHWY